MIREVADPVIGSCQRCRENRECEHDCGKRNADAKDMFCSYVEK
jgi:hypothetical protein